MTAPYWVGLRKTTTCARSAFGGRWQDRRWMNTPGPYYTAGADFVLLGPLAVPALIAIDQGGVDVVFRQPTHVAEVQELEAAADNGPFQGYARDGNDHWTPDGIREWWRRRAEIVNHAETLVRGDAWPHPQERVVLQRAGRDWLDHLANGVRDWLRQYAFFVEQRTWPAPDARLPDL